MNIQDVVKFIITDASVDGAGMNSLITAIRERQRLNRANTTAIAKATLQVGMRVSVSGISPKYLNGMVGVITSFNKTRSRADIEIVDNKRDYRVSVGSIKHGFPVQCLTAVDTAPKSVLTDSDANALMEFMGG